MKMKKRYLLLGACAVAFMIVRYKSNLNADVFDEIGGFFKDVRKKISDTYDDAVNALKRVPACADVVAEGVKWTAMQASYYTAMGVLDVSKTLQKTDPRISALRAQIGGFEAAMAGLDATMAAGQKGLDVVAAAGKWGVGVIADVGDTVGRLLAKGINLQKLEFEANVADLKKGKLPMTNISGIFAGKQADLKVQINLDNIGDSLVSIAKAVQNLV